jgi:hypothetical protein
LYSIHTAIYQPLQVIKLDYSTSQEDSGAFGEVDIPEEQRLKERQVDTLKRYWVGVTDPKIK